MAEARFPDAWTDNWTEVERQAAAFRRLTTTLICHPAAEARVRSAVAQAMEGVEPPHPRVRPDILCPEGEVYVIDSSKMSGPIPWADITGGGS